MERNILSTIKRVQVVKAFMKSSYLKALMMKRGGLGTRNLQFSFQRDKFGILILNFPFQAVLKVHQLKPSPD